ncbi:MAG: YihA family ribosome biogenesis GTP-binding protein [Bacteroidales bacterium]|nr:YihA family ribosome biogenesis GTP-binding protein [Bacteroidales bacterium]
MVIKEATFIKSATTYKACPLPDKHEVAFIGRSNVGKSSLINMLCNNRKLAKTSSTPGKTQTINHFLINKLWYLVDLPGYGYAKVNKQLRNTFANFISDYILNRPNLDCLFILVDSRHEPRKIDLEFITWCGENEIPIAIVMTKTDKLKPAELEHNINVYVETLLQEWEETPPMYYTSAENKNGKEELLEYIGQIVEPENIE